MGNMRRALASAAATAAICTLALAVCCALIASADLRKSGSSLLEVVPLGSIMAPRRILYGLGSGEEQDAANQNAVAWGSFADQDAYAHDLLGADHYAVQFDEALNSDATQAAIAEVNEAVGECKNEHDLLATFASG